MMLFILSFDFVDLLISFAVVFLALWFNNWRKNFEEETRSVQFRPVFQYSGEDNDKLDHEKDRSLAYRFDIFFRNVGHVCFYFDSFPKESDKNSYWFDQYKKKAIVGRDNEIKLKFVCKEKQECYVFHLQFRDMYKNLYQQRIEMKHNNRNKDAFEYVIGPPELVVE